MTDKDSTEAPQVMSQTLTGIGCCAILCAGMLLSHSAMAAPVTHGVMAGEVSNNAAVI